jgi:Family of unknown function (DUF5946)
VDQEARRHAGSRAGPRRSSFISSATTSCRSPVFVSVCSTVTRKVESNCPSCGGVYSVAGDSCAARFDELLALDHSRTEPWGSRHALAFSVFALQHANRFDRKVLQRSWTLLYNVFERGRDPRHVTTALRRLGNRDPHWDSSTLPCGSPVPPFAMTIADMGDFGAATYPEMLERWCKVTVAHWRSACSCS